ncbi:hypothetical protein C8R45DRAFT_154233 [Mycena sanguinolenta]|nr:hypothetical protein C8R45DRAFT_154233 [Mycena sanguinolenta]
MESVAPIPASPLLPPLAILQIFTLACSCICHALAFSIRRSRFFQAHQPSHQEATNPIIWYSVAWVSSGPKIPPALGIASHLLAHILCKFRPFSSQTLQLCSHLVFSSRMCALSSAKDMTPTGTWHPPSTRIHAMASAFHPLRRKTSACQGLHSLMPSRVPLLFPRGNYPGTPRKLMASGPSTAFEPLSHTAEAPTSHYSNRRHRSPR